MISRKTIEQYTKTPGVKNEIDDIFTKTLFVQRICGHQILDPTWVWSRFRLKHMFIAFIFIYVILGTVAVIKETTNVTIVFEAAYTLVMICCLFIKYSIFISTKFKLRDVYLSVKTSLYPAVKEECDEKANEMLKKAKFVVKVFFIIFLVPNVSYWLGATFCFATGARVTLSRTTSIMMPMTTPTYEIGMSLHMMYLFHISYTMYVIDMWFVFFMFSFCIASDTFGKILQVDSKYMGESNASYAKRLNVGLKKFYSRHVLLMEYLTKLNVLYKWLTLIPLIQSLIGSCLICLLITEEISWSFIGSNTVPTFAELYAFCWLGEQIKTKMENLANAVLEFDWTSLALKDKKSYCIIVSYMNQGFGISTAVGKDLSFITMSAILKGSYQAFAVLNTMREA